MRSVPRLHLGNGMPLGSEGAAAPFSLPAHHLVTHGVIVAMTGSGKTGLVTVLAEEALRTRTTVLMIDVKGDLHPPRARGFASGATSCVISNTASPAPTASTAVGAILRSAHDTR